MMCKDSFRTRRAIPPVPIKRIFAIAPIFLTIGALGACSDTGTVATTPDAAPPDRISEDGPPADDAEALCGNGVLDPWEACDTAIPEGDPGACPERCEAGDPCIVATLVGQGCEAHCIEARITRFLDNDGCCPEGANAALDSDCPGECGNGVLDPGETCDPPSSCPTSCDDSDPCTADSLSGDPNLCNAVCSHDPITSCTDGDGCCPAGCDASSDSDCSAVCGNGVTEPGETCDPPSSCPTSCDDSDPCTADSMSGDPDLCNVSCSHDPITSCTDGDGCCPAGCDASSDSDCSATCGNGVTEPGEQCDDGNTNPGDGCSPDCQWEPTAFRIDWMALRDPHVFVRVLWSCYDVTDNGVFGAPSVNEQMNDNIQNDGDGDGYLDLSLVVVMRPLDQSPSYSGRADFAQALCTAPAASTTCSPDPSNPPQQSTYANQGSGVCLEPYPGTTSGYSPGITVPSAPPVCFSMGTLDVTLNFAGTLFTLHDAELAAVYDADPATGYVNGLIRGFMSEAEADDIMVDLGALGTQPLSSLLQPDACGPGDDQDLGPDGQTLGWWFYLNFTAVVVPWNE